MRDQILDDKALGSLQTTKSNNATNRTGKSHRKNTQAQGYCKTNLPTIGGGRAAYSLKEAARLFGKDRCWAYRMVEQGKLRAITGFGAMLIPASEIERICEGGAAQP